MSRLLEPYPLAAIFPELPAEELRLLAHDIKERGQIEPIILYKGQILDGRNRYRACQMVGVKPRFEEFNPKSAQRSPEEFVLSRNLRRRHLSSGQKAAIALEWADQLELRPRTDAKTKGRPRGAVLEAAKHIGIERQRVFEARQIRETNAGLYKELKGGLRSLNSVLEEIRPQNEKRLGRLGSFKSGKGRQEPDGNTHHETPGLEPAGGAGEARGPQKPTNQKAAATSQLSPAPSPEAVEKALTHIRTILGRSFHAEVNARTLIKSPEEIIQFAKLTDAQMKEVGSLLKKGWMFAAALREVVERLTPDNEIRALHTRTIENGGAWCLVTIGDFGHAVVRGNGKDKVLAKIKEFLAKSSA
jgi:ParB-like nuclease family protein